VTLAPNNTEARAPVETQAAPCSGHGANPAARTTGRAARPGYSAARPRHPSSGWFIRAAQHAFTVLNRYCLVLVTAINLSVDEIAPEAALHTRLQAIVVGITRCGRGGLTTTWNQDNPDLKDRVCAERCTDQQLAPLPVEPERDSATIASTPDQPMNQPTQ
jgi:hypothetical protein